LKNPKKLGKNVKSCFCEDLGQRSQEFLFALFPRRPCLENQRNKGGTEMYLGTKVMEGTRIIVEGDGGKSKDH